MNPQPLSGMVPQREATAPLLQRGATTSLLQQGQQHFYDGREEQIRTNEPKNYLVYNVTMGQHILFLYRTGCVELWCISHNQEMYLIQQADSINELIVRCPYISYYVTGGKITKKMRRNGDFKELTERMDTDTCANNGCDNKCSFRTCFLVNGLTIPWQQHKTCNKCYQERKQQEREQKRQDKLNSQIVWRTVSISKGKKKNIRPARTTQAPSVVTIKRSQ
jgi:hypothetical protein